MKYEAAGNRVECRRIDSVDQIQPIDAVELHQHWSDGPDVAQFAEAVADRDRHRRTAESHENGSGGRLDHDVRTHALDTLGGVSEQAGGKTHYDNHQGHFDRHRQHSDHRSYRAMQHVLHDHALDQFFGSAPDLGWAP